MLERAIHMLRTVGLVTSVLLIALSQVSCDRAHHSPPRNALHAKSYEDYRDLVTSLVMSNSLKTIPLDGRDTPFFKDPAVIALYQHPKKAESFAWTLMLDESVNLEVRQYQVRLLQCLPLHELRLLLLRANEALSSGDLQPDVVTTMLAPGSEWGTTLSLAHQDAEVREAVGRIAGNPRATQAIRERASDLLSGAQAAYVSAYNRPQEPLPRIPCP